jgi:predicted O-methyltransferase YrrM
LFDIGSSSDGGIFVEIGTAHGAGTISLALGAIATQKKFHIYTVDPFCGEFSSRTKFGSIDQNMAFVRSRFKEFGVDDYVTIMPGFTDDLVRLHAPKDIQVLLIDADGRIDRDLSILFDRLSRDCVIVIDDIVDWSGISTVNGVSTFDQKHRLSYHLTKAFVANCLLEETCKIRSTGFFRKGRASVTPDQILISALPAYRELVFSRVELPRQRSALRSWIGEKVPFARPIYRKFKGWFVAAL